MKKTYRKVKKFVNDHKEEILTGTIYASAAAAYAGLLAYAVKQDKKAQHQQQEADEWVRQQNFSGKTVYKLANGSLIAVSQEQVS